MPRFKRFAILALLLACLTLALSPSPARADGCVYANNAQAYYAPGYDFFCASGNGSCAQCATTYPGGYTICTSDSSGFTICIDYQD